MRRRSRAWVRGPCPRSHWTVRTRAVPCTIRGALPWTSTWRRASSARPPTPASCALFSSQPSTTSSQASGVAFSLTKVHILFRGADLLAYHTLLQRDVEYTFTDLAHRTQLATVRANGEHVKIAVLSASGNGRTRIVTATPAPSQAESTPSYQLSSAPG